MEGSVSSAVRRGAGNDVCFEAIEGPSVGGAVM